MANKEDKTVIPECKWCHKEFSRPSQHRRHETEQICRSKTQRTYCKICNVTYPTRQTFDNHLITRKHIENLMKEDTTLPNNTLNVNTRVVVHDPMYMADPLLTKEEAESISMGRDPTAKSMTLYMKDKTATYTSSDPLPCPSTRQSSRNNGIGIRDPLLMGVKRMNKDPGLIHLDKTATIEEQYQQLREAEKTPKEKEIERVQSQATDYKKVLESMYSTPEPTDRQHRILQYLGKWQDEPTRVMTDKFKPVLAALKLPDANYLRRHIMEAPDNVLSLSAKQVYVGYLDTFVEHIIGLTVEGTRTHLAPDVPFDKLVINLNR